MKKIDFLFRRYGKYVIPMLISYFILWGALYYLILKPQSKTIASLKNQKNTAGYDVLNLKNLPGFVTEITSTVETADAKLNDFEWLHSGIDPNLTFFQYIAGLAEHRGLSLISLLPAARPAAAGQSKDAKNAPVSYYSWNASFEGNFLNVFGFINDIERGPLYLKIKELAITPEQKKGTVFTFTILGINKLD